MLYTILGTACLLGLFAWSRDRASDPVPAPFWVGAPQAAGYYTGVGLVSSSGDKARDLRRAEEEARGNLAQNIRAHVSSRSESRMEEMDGVYWEHFSSRVRITSRLSIPGAVVADRWYDPGAKTYYCYVKAPIADLMAFQRANQREIETYIAAEQARIDGLDKAAVMSQYVRRQVQLIEYMRQHYQGGLVGAQYRLQLIHQTQQSYAALADVLAAVEWDFEPLGPVPALVPVDLELVLSSHYGGRPLPRMPMTAAWAEGYGLIEQEAESGPDGSFGLGLYQINSVRPDNAIAIAADVYALVPDSLVRAYPAPPQLLVKVSSFDPKSDIACYLAGVEGAGYASLKSLQGRLAGYLGRSGFQVFEAESLGASQGPEGRDPGLWVVLSARIRGRETEAQWRVYNTLRSERICRSGVVRQRWTEKSPQAIEDQLQKMLYTRVRGEIADAVGTCLGL